MISCLGQQNVDGKRIPYGFSNRTLPHYSKFDDSPEARGFVESSFISGLTQRNYGFMLWVVEQVLLILLLRLAQQVIFKGVLLKQWKIKKFVMI